MNKHLTTLELHKILAMLSEQAGNDETRKMISELEPETDIEKVKESLKKTDDAFTLSVKFGTPPFYNFKDIRGSLQRAQSGSSLTLRELLDICSMLKQIRGLTDYHASCGDTETVLDPLFCDLSP
ncbi:MAG: endonuclease MutS2, partial [Oscillospiraceae bacterium]|nr:endonuclease MutS2 [Oscillospiraceae bacterium]